MSVWFSDGSYRSLPPLGCGRACHTDEQRPRRMGCLSMFANVGVGNCQILSGRAICRTLRAPVMGLAASVVAELPVATALSAVWARPGERKQPTAMLAASKLTARGHKPIHLKVGSS